MCNVFSFLCPQITSFFVFIPTLQPAEVKGRDITSSSVESNALYLSHEHGIGYAKQLKTDEENNSCVDFGTSDTKYLLYEDEQDFKVRFMKKIFSTKRMPFY